MSKPIRELGTQSRPYGLPRSPGFGTVLTIAEVSKILRIHRNTVYRLVKSGDLPGFKIGDNWRVYEEDLRTVIASKLPLSRAAALKS